MNTDQEISEPDRLTLLWRLYWERIQELRSEIEESEFKLSILDEMMSEESSGHE